MWRNPHENWISPMGYVVQLGDAAHTFLPSSGNGATQSMEDGIYLASCLQLAGKAQIPLAAKVYNKLRCVFLSIPHLLFPVSSTIFLLIYLSMPISLPNLTNSSSFSNLTVCLLCSSPLTVLLKSSFQRVSCAQKMGFKTRNAWIRADLDELTSNPRKLAPVIGKWVASHQPEKYVYDNYANCVKNVIGKGEFINS